tara:strand:- start:1567 stop:2154 length:588 start_codon:yes stop_codon:yes gene_type:complete
MNQHSDIEKTPIKSQRKSKALFFILVPCFFIIFAGILGFQLITGDPRTIPSALIDKPVPKFNLPPPPSSQEGFSDNDLRNGEVVLVNVFASWCGPCLVEHPLLMDLAKSNNVKIYGLNYKDSLENSSSWLKRYGNPYKGIGSDMDGRVGIDWGVYGIPETFIVDGDGRIRFKHVGILTREDLSEVVLPLISELRR